MAQQFINIGTSANKGDGEPLRTAFDKINDNFTEVYGDIQALKSGAIVADVKGTIIGDDSTILVDGVNSSINLAGTVKSDIIPDANVTYDIGSATKRFKDLYLSGNTINLGGTTLSISNGELQIGGTSVAGTIDYNDLQNLPTFDGTFGALTGTPTTLSGYGITDAYTKSQVDNAVQNVTQGRFSFNITGDDSTVRTVQSGSNISIKGGGNIDTASNIDGDIQIDLNPQLDITHLTNSAGVLNINGDVDFGNAGTIDFTGSTITGLNYGSISGTPTVLTSVNDISNVSNPQDNDVLVYSSGDWTNSNSATFEGGLTVEESYSATPTTKYFEIETGAGNNRLLRTGVNMSAFAQEFGPEIDLTSYRSSPANGDAGPELVLRASTGASANDVIANIGTEVTNTTDGAVTSNISFTTKNNGSYATPITITGNTVAFSGSVTGLPSQVAGSPTQVQYNSSGAFAGSSYLTFDDSQRRLYVGQTETSTGIVQTSKIMGPVGEYLYLQSAAGVSNSTHVLMTTANGSVETTFTGDIDFIAGATVDFANATISNFSHTNSGGVAYQYGYSAHDAVSTAGSDFAIDSTTVTMAMTATTNGQGARIDISGITTNASAGTGLIFIQRRVNAGSWTVWNSFVVAGAGDHFSHSFVDFYNTGGSTFDVAPDDVVEYKLTNGTDNTNYGNNVSGAVDFELFFGFQFTATEIPLNYTLTQP